jgi:outer membrane protein TolC
MKIKLKNILILLLITAAVGSAQTVNLNLVNDAIEYAFDNNPDLVIYKQNQTKAQYDYNSVKNYWLPKITGSFSSVNYINLPVTLVPGEFFGQPGEKIEAEFGAQYNYNAGINISSSILDFQSKFIANASEVNIEIAKANQDVYKQKLAEQVAFYYYTAIITKRALEIHDRNYESAEKTVVIVEQKFEQGIVDQRTVNLAKINKNNVLQNKSTYQIVFEQCYSNLTILLGLEPGTEIIFSENLDSEAIKIPSVDFIGPDKSLEIYKLQLRQSDYKVSQERAKWYPKLYISGYLGTQQYQDNFGISFNNSSWSTVSYLSLNISLPIFNGFVTKSQVNSALIEYDISKNTLEQEVSKSRIEDELILKEFSYSKEAVNAAKENYQLSKQNADLQLQKYEEGLLSLDKYLEAFDDYLIAEVTYVNLLSDSYNYYSKILSRNL